MSDAEVTKVEQWMEALRAKDLDAALALMSDEPVMDTPMGTKKGPAKVRGMLGVVANMGGANGAEPVREGDVVTAIGSSPMGKVKLTFDFAGEAIEKVTAKLGAK